MEGGNIIHDNNQKVKFLTVKWKDTSLLLYDWEWKKINILGPHF